MKILWVMNSPIGPAASILGKAYDGTSGGWIQSEYETLLKQDVDFFVLSTLPSVIKGEVLHKQSNIGELYCVHAPRVSSGVTVSGILRENVQQIIQQINPDVIHIWGTETWLSNEVSKCKTAAPKVIFIQGLIGVHRRYLGGYFGNLSEDRKYCARKAFIVRVKSLFRNSCFLRQVEIERETIANCGNVIVDSDFARAYCTSIRPDIQCFQHTLMPNQLFENRKWKLEQCQRHSIFTVFGSSAEKGTQNLLKAVAIVKDSIPDVTVYIPGTYNLDTQGKLLPGQTGSFQNVLYRIMQDYGLTDHICFTGRLNAAQMAETMERCHLFVNPSCMEVHALSLREAMVEGVPCISAQCGSVAEYLRHRENGLMYRYEEFETLAYYIKMVFQSDELANRLSTNAVKTFEMLQKDDLSLNQVYQVLQS